MLTEQHAWRLQDKDGYTPLHIAAGYMYQGVVRLLVKNGADPEKKDKANRSVRNNP